MAARVNVGPLSGVRVLDMTRLYPGPLCAMMLGDMGADVIKVEDPHAPDALRQIPPWQGGWGVGFLAVNRSKRSLALRWHTPEGRSVFEELLKSADVVLEPFRPGYLALRGWGFEKFQSLNPRLILVSLTGYGQDGPLASHAGHDINFVGYSGVLAATGHPGGDPVVCAAQLADVSGAWMAVLGCLAALVERFHTGKGRHVDVSMADASLNLMTLPMAHMWAFGETPERGQHMLSGGLACYGVYRCQDGKYLALGALEPKFWDGFCQKVGLEAWVGKNLVFGDENQQLREVLTELFLTCDRDAWIEKVGGPETCITPVLDPDEVEAHPQFQARQMIMEQAHPDAGGFKSIASPVRFQGQEPAAMRPPPRLGEHTREILEELGLGESQLAELEADGTILRG